jgi:LPS sulfotransferase NodH
MSDRVRFVIVSCPRTGSTYLVDYLAALPGVSCLSEIFRRGEVLLRTNRPIPSENLDVAARDVDPLGWLEQLDRAFGAVDWFGFKLFSGQQWPLLRHLCADPTWKKIYLRRNNFLDQYVSFFLAIHHFGETEWGRVPSDRDLTIDPNTIVQDLEAIEANYFAMEEMLGHAYRTDLFGIEYEDLGRAAVMQQLLEFLGLPDSTICEATSGTASMSERRIPLFERGPGARERIRNYDEIAMMLQTTRFQAFLHSDEPR